VHLAISQRVNGEEIDRCAGIREELTGDEALLVLVGAQGERPSKGARVPLPRIRGGVLRDDAGDRRAAGRRRVRRLRPRLRGPRPLRRATGIRSRLPSPRR
jgi:hypothetical protein